MSSKPMTGEQIAEAPSATKVDQKLEVVILPVSDVDRAKRFYASLGWRLDADFTTGEAWRALQMTPPGSPCSILFGKGLTDAVPGSVRGTFLVVDDIQAARSELLGRGVEVSEVFHFGHELRVTGPRARWRRPSGHQSRNVSRACTVPWSPRASSTVTRCSPRRGTGLSMAST